MAGLEIISVRRRGEIKAFMELPWDIYRGDVNWVPPIRSEFARLLDPERHPFWQHAERELFLVRRGSETLGRLAAIIDRDYLRHRQEKMAAWGFFECVRDPEAAVALFAAAEKWARDRDLAFLRGPLNPSINYEVGLLVQGFDSPPVLLMSYNPPYYPELVQLCGYRKEKDLFAYLFTPDFHPPPWSLELAHRLAAKGEVSIRNLDPGHFEREVRLLHEIYNESWSENWGAVPVTYEELLDMVQAIRPIADLDLAFFLYFRGEPAGVCIILPDINPLLKRFDGAGGLTALIKKHLYWSKEVKGLRGFILGVKEKYRQMGLPFVAFDYLIKLVAQKPQYRYMEMGWNLEDNLAINRLYEEGGLKPYKRYRLYRKDL